MILSAVENMLLVRTYGWDGLVYGIIDAFCASLVCG